MPDLMLFANEMQKKFAHKTGNANFRLQILVKPDIYQRDRRVSKPYFRLLQYLMAIFAYSVEVNVLI